MGEVKRVGKCREERLIRSIDPKIYMNQVMWQGMRQMQKRGEGKMVGRKLPSCGGDDDYGGGGKGGVG